MAEPALIGTTVGGLFALAATLVGKLIEKRRDPLDGVSIEMEHARELNDMLRAELNELRVEREALRREIAAARAEIEEARVEVRRLRQLVRDLGGEP